MLIAVTGAKGAGKDSLAHRLVVMHGFTNLKMAGALKAMLSTLFAYAGLSPDEIHEMLEGNQKEVPHEILKGKTPRHAMQTLGHEWRNLIDENLWTAIFEKRLRSLLHKGYPIVCTDIRYPHEAELIRRYGGRIVRIERPGTGTGDLHPSETEMLKIQVDETFNNDRSLQNLWERVDRYVVETFRK